MVTYVVDVDSKIGNNRADEIEKRQGSRPKFVEDIRKMLDDKTSTSSPSPRPTTGTR